MSEQKIPQDLQVDYKFDKEHLPTKNWENISQKRKEVITTVDWEEKKCKRDKM